MRSNDFGTLKGEWTSCAAGDGQDICRKTCATSYIIFVGKQRWSLAEMTFLHSIFHLKVNLQATGDMTNEVFPQVESFSSS